MHVCWSLNYRFKSVLYACSVCLPFTWPLLLLAGWSDLILGSSWHPATHSKVCSLQSLVLDLLHPVAGAQACLNFSSVQLTQRLKKGRVLTQKIDTGFNKNIGLRSSLSCCQFIGQHMLTRLASFILFFLYSPMLVPPSSTAVFLFFLLCSLP